MKLLKYKSVIAWFWVSLVFAASVFGQVPNPAGPIPLVQTVPLTNSIYGRIGITNMMLLVRGDNVIGDGGGGVFAWLHGDTNTADNARYFAATNGGNWYKISYWDDGTGGGGGGGGLGTNAFVNGVLFQPIMFTNNLSSDVGRLIWYTNANGHVVGYATNVASSSSYVAAASSPPITEAYFQATTDIFYNVSGTNIQAYLVTEAVEDLIGASLVAGSNITISYDDSGTGKTTVSGISSGATNGTPVNVDGGSVLVAANFTDTTGINFGVSGTNVTANLTDRNWGDITTSSSGTSVAINANSVTLGTDTTGNYIATIAGTANEVDASGSGSETAGVIVSLPTTIDLGGKTSFEVPNSAAPTVDAFGEVAGDNDAWAAGRGALLFYDGTAATRLVGVLASDTPSNGQVPKWNTGGTITWEDDNISGGGSGGGLGTNFVLNGVLLQPATITNGLSVIWSTNANGHAVAAVSLVETNIPSTIARLDSPTFTGTVTFDTLVANTLQVPFASRYAAANASSNLVATSDGQSWTNLNGSSIATGTVADARIDAALARLSSPTFTGDPKAPTASPGDNDTSIASTAFVTAAVAAGGGSGGTGTVVTASGGSDMSRANITTNGFGLLVTQSGTNILLSTTNNYPVDYYAGGFLPLFAGVSNALTGDLSMDQNSDVRLFMSETSRMLTDGYEVMGLRAYNGKLALHSFATNDLSAAEEFMVIDPSDLVGPTDIITFPNSGFNNKVVFEADVEFNGTSTFSGTTTFSDLAIGTITVVSNLTVPNNPYGAGWNGSTNVPNENSVYDEMELRAPKASPSFTGAATNTGSFGAPTLYVGSTNVAVAIASFSSSDTNWNGNPIASGTITNLTTSTVNLGGTSRTNWPRSNERGYEWISSSMVYPEISGAFAQYPWFGAVIASGTFWHGGSGYMGSDPTYLRAYSSSSANSGGYLLTYRDAFLLTNDYVGEFYFRPLATNSSTIRSRLGWQDSVTTALPADGLYMDRDGNQVSLIGRNNSSTTQSSSYVIASNAVYFGSITTRNASGGLAADLKLWDSTQTLVTTLSITNGTSNATGRESGFGWICWSTNNVSVPIEDVGYIATGYPTLR
jgi:hypothetical protein